MKIQLIKSTIKFITLSVLFFFNSCSDMKNQTDEMINLYKTQLNEELIQLKNEEIITQDERQQINKKLNADLEYYQKHQDIDLDVLKKMFFNTVKSFENIEINQPVFSTISTTYNSITAQIAMRNFPIKQEDFVIQTELNNIMNNWFENYQNDDQKLLDLIVQITKTKKQNIYPNISDKEYNDIISNITQIKDDATITNNEIKQILTNGMLKYCNKDNDANLFILNIYGTVDSVKKLGIENLLIRMYDKQWKNPKEPSFMELKREVTSKLTSLLKDEFITAQNFEELSTIIINDINFCEKKSNTAIVKSQLLASLKKMKPLSLDTEEREMIVDWYFIISKKNNVDINNDLNKWLYDFDLN